MDKKEITYFRIGLFDALKGLGIICVILFHTFNSVLVGNNNEMTLWGVSKNILSIFGCALMPTFFLISGYGFRPISIKKSFSHYSKSILYPYYVTGIATAILIFIHESIFSSDSIYTNFQKARCIIEGFLFATTPDKTMVFGRYVSYPGPCWFLFTLFGVFFLLSILMKKIEKEYIFPISIVLWSGSCLLSYFYIAPFCINRILTNLIYVYIGYYFKKNKKWLLLSKRKVLLSMIFIISGIFIFSLEKQFLTEKSFMIMLTKNAIETVLNIIVGYILLIFGVWISQFENIVVNMLSFIGQNSILFLCMHTVEFIIKPWKSFFPAVYENNRLWLIFFIRIFFISMVSVIIRYRVDLVRKIKSIICGGKT